MMKIKREAVAIKYDQMKDSAPKGEAGMAEKIIVAGKAHAIPIQEDPSLGELVGKLDINTTIPAELYEAVSEVFAFICRADRNLGAKKQI
ncbi:MAG: EscU/YscU/HrcU family type III secretion system export apparatus switch protein [Bacillus sp. (in: firmicutes)]